MKDITKIIGATVATVVGGTALMGYLVLNSPKLTSDRMVHGNRVMTSVSGGVLKPRENEMFVKDPQGNITEFVEKDGAVYVVQKDGSYLQATGRDLSNYQAYSK